MRIRWDLDERLERHRAIARAFRLRAKATKVVESPTRTASDTDVLSTVRERANLPAVRRSCSCQMKSRTCGASFEAFERRSPIRARQRNRIVKLKRFCVFVFKHRRCLLLIPFVLCGQNCRAEHIEKAMHFCFHFVPKLPDRMMQSSRKFDRHLVHLRGRPARLRFQPKSETRPRSRHRCAICNQMLVLRCLNLVPQSDRLRARRELGGASQKTGRLPTRLRLLNAIRDRRPPAKTFPAE